MKTVNKGKESLINLETPWRRDLETRAIRDACIRLNLPDILVVLTMQALGW